MKPQRKPAQKNLPPFIAKLLTGAVIQWEDKTPLSIRSDEELRFWFDTNTCATTDILLRKYGITDVSHIVNVRLRWHVTITVEYRTPNKGEGMYRQETDTFYMHAPIFPFSEKIRNARDKFYLQCQLENQQIPSDKKAWGIYNTTRFKAVCLGA